MKRRFTGPKQPENRPVFPAQNDDKTGRFSRPFVIIFVRLQGRHPSGADPYRMMEQAGMVFE